MCIYIIICIIYIFNGYVTYCYIIVDNHPSKPPAPTNAPEGTPQRFGGLRSPVATVLQATPSINSISPNHLDKQPSTDVIIPTMISFPSHVCLDIYIYIYGLD